MNEKAELAYKDYLKGLKYKEIAELHNVSVSTVKSWASRYWKKKGCNPKEKVATKKKTGAFANIYKNINKLKKSEEEIVDNEKLEITEKQRLFCIYYMEEFNATKAYQKAYNCDYATANTNG